MDLFITACQFPFDTTVSYFVYQGQVWKNTKLNESHSSCADSYEAWTKTHTKIVELTDSVSLSLMFKIFIVKDQQ